MKKKNWKKLLYSLVSLAIAIDILYTGTHTHTHTDTGHGHAIHTVREELLLQMGACRLAHVNTNTYIVHRRKEIKVFSPSLLWSRGVLKLPAPNNICCSLLPLLSADEEGVPTRGSVNGGKSYKSNSTTG